MSQKNTLRGFCPVCNPLISFTKEEKNNSEKLEIFSETNDYFLSEIYQIIFFGADISTLNKQL